MVMMVVRRFLALVALVVGPLVFSTCRAEGVGGVPFTCAVKSPIGVSSSSSAEYGSRPYVNGATKFMHGAMTNWYGSVENVSSPIYDLDTNERIMIGAMAQMGEAEALEAVESAKKAWNNGHGVWPQMSAAQRIDALENVVRSLKERRSEIVNVLMWEIAKTSADAAAEFGKQIVNGLIFA
jgi:glyceraldehyde-3-phosphate dehydrogenase (NADP+)